MLMQVTIDDDLIEDIGDYMKREGLGLYEEAVNEIISEFFFGPEEVEDEK